VRSSVAIARPEEEAPGEGVFRYGPLVGASLTLVLYLFTARITLEGMFEPQGMTSFWPAAGLALGILICSPLSHWRWLVPAVFGGSLLSSLFMGFPFPLSLSFAVANTAEPLVGASLLRFRFRRRVYLEEIGEGVGLLLATIPAALVGSALGALSIALFGSGSSVTEVVPLWFVGDYLGILLVAPVVMSWWPKREPEGLWPAARDRLWALVILMGLAAVVVVVFQADPAPEAVLYTPFWTLPFLLLAALVLGVRGVSLGTLLVAVASVAFTVAGHGPFALPGMEVPERVLALQMYLILNIVPLLLLAAALEGLRRREEEYRRVIENTQEGVWLSDLRDRAIFVNSRLCEMLGLRLGDCQGRTPAELLGADGLTLTTGGGRGGVERDKLEVTGLPAIRQELPVQVDGGDTRWLSIATDPVEDRAGRRVGTLRLVTDITARKDAEAERERLEASLQQAQKMEAVGRLAGGIAHDFNNLLTVIMGYSEVLLQSPTMDDSRDRRRVEAVVSAAENARSLVGQLLAYSRKQVLQLRAADLREVPKKVAGMVGRLLGEDVRLEVNMPPDPVWARIDPHLLEQALMNLVLNARDAMPGGGAIRVEVEAGRPDPRYGTPLRAGLNQCAILRVSDTGTGIPAEDLERVFDPFFSTKEAGRGTGLGLSMVEGTVTQHGGDVRVWSLMGEGATFELLLPLADDHPDLAGEVEGPAPLDRGTETILLVEDEPAVLSYATSALEELGYRVLSAARGSEALHILQNNRSVDLVVTDVVMPGMSGLELLDAIRRESPKLPVLLMSGYSGGLVEHARPDGVDAPFLAKPFRMKELAEAVRGALDPGAPGASGF
jgi:PAS domain S-box-containing protein